MRVISSIDYSILEVDGKIRYRLNEPFTYYSKRYDKYVTVDTRYLSDGATGAPDISSRSWWVHDQLCETGMFDDGTKCSNWQASQVLQDIMVEESPPKGWERYRPSSRYWQSKRWFWATWLCGGGQARKNGLFSAT